MRYASTILFVLLACLFSCDEELSPLATKLVDTTWKINKVEIYDETGVLERTVFPVDDCHDIAIEFRNYGKIIHGSGCSSTSYGCGKWSASNSKISFSFSSGQFVKGLCRLTNFSSLYKASGVAIEFSNEEIVIDGWTATLRVISNEIDLIDLQHRNNEGLIRLRTYYTKRDLPLTNDFSCCIAP